MNDLTHCHSTPLTPAGSHGSGFSLAASTAMASPATGSHPGGRCYNAVDGCKRLGIDGTTMDKQWAGAKKAGNLVKFGGGFYAGKIPAPAQSDNGWISGAILAIYALFSS